MLEDIKLIGLNNDELDEVINELDFNTILSMACNYKKIKENIHIFKSIGINNIVDLLIYKNNVFFVDSDLLIEKLSKISVLDFVDAVNSDYFIIDELFVN